MADERTPGIMRDGIQHSYCVCRRALRAEKSSAREEVPEAEPDLFAVNGYGAAGIPRPADAAPIPKASLYSRFANKQDIPVLSSKPF